MRYTLHILTITLPLSVFSSFSHPQPLTLPPTSLNCHSLTLSLRLHCRAPSLSHHRSRTLALFHDLDPLSFPSSLTDHRLESDTPLASHPPRGTKRASSQSTRPSPPQMSEHPAISPVPPVPPSTDPAPSPNSELSNRRRCAEHDLTTTRHSAPRQGVVPRENDRRLGIHLDSTTFATSKARDDEGETRVKRPRDGELTLSHAEDTSREVGTVVPERNTGKTAAKDPNGGGEWLSHAHDMRTGVKPPNIRPPSSDTHVDRSIRIESRAESISFDLRLSDLPVPYNPAYPHPISAYASPGVNPAVLAMSGYDKVLEHLLHTDPDTVKGTILASAEGGDVFPPALTLVLTPGEGLGIPDRFCQQIESNGAAGIPVGVAGVSPYVQGNGHGSQTAPRFAQATGNGTPWSEVTSEQNLTVKKDSNPYTLDAQRQYQLAQLTNTFMGKAPVGQYQPRHSFHVRTTGIERRGFDTPGQWDHGAKSPSSPWHRTELCPSWDDTGLCKYGSECQVG